MKLWVWSDMHLEFSSSDFRTLDNIVPPADADIIVCAGDLAWASHYPRLTRHIVEKFDIPLLIVPGNHEYYSQDSFESALHLMLDVAQRSIDEDWAHPVNVLQRKTLVLGDVRFVGATGWVDFAYGLEGLDDTEFEKEIAHRFHEAPHILNDFKMIWRRLAPFVFSPERMLQLHQEDRNHILSKIEEPFDGNTIVLTHHMPHPDCTPEMYKNNKHNYLFASSEKPFGELFHSDMAPDLWICGHTHEAFDIEVGRTRIVCNPHGYDHEAYTNGFTWDKVIDTDDLRPQPSRSL